jgi:putative copper resistance protein D
VADVAAIAVRALLYLDLMLLFGIPAYALLAPAGAAPAKLRAIAIAGAATGLALTLLALVLLVADMAGTGLADLDRESIRLVLAETPPGRAALWRATSLALLVLLGLAPGADTAGWRAAAATLAGIALASLAWGGHGAATEGALGNLHLGADLVHLLAAGLWLGALAVLVAALLGRSPDAARLHRALSGFSRLGTLLVAAILASGLVNAWVLVGPDGLAALPATLYGRLLLAKLALFALMVALAARNRFRLTPRLTSAGADSPRALRALRRSVGLETLAGGAIVALVAWLGTLEPIAGM